MKNPKIKTIDVNAKEYFDKVNGNSYFSGKVTINYGMNSVKDFKMPFQYGYGESYLQEAKKILTEFNQISGKFLEYECLTRFCRENKIILRYHKEKNCKKRDL